MPADDALAPARAELPSEQCAASACTELISERAHLDESRRALARMRERSTAMTAHSGDRLSREYLKLTLNQRMQALEDDPDVPLFFGRLD